MCFGGFDDFAILVVFRFLQIIKKILKISKKVSNKINLNAKIIVKIGIHRKDRSIPSIRKRDHKLENCMFFAAKFLKNFSGFGIYLKKKHF